MSLELFEQLNRIESMLVQMLSSSMPIDQQYYATSDVAKLLGKAEWTVREWCRLGRVHCQKRESGRGSSKEWMISHEELCRIKSEGLLPWNIKTGRRS